MISPATSALNIGGGPTAGELCGWSLANPKLRRVWGAGRVWATKPDLGTPPAVLKAGSGRCRPAREARTLADNFPPAAARGGRTLQPAGRHRRAVIAGARTRRVPPRGGSAARSLSGLLLKTP